MRQCKEYNGLERAHLERRAGTKAQAIAYCKKSAGRVAGPWEYGELGAAGGRRSDLKAFVDAVFSGEVLRPEVVVSYPEILAKYPRFVDAVYERKRQRSLPVRSLVPREGWQQVLFTTLCGQPDPREIHWYYDATGGSGKSYFANNYEGGYVITGGKHADVFYAYNFEKVVFFDWPRDFEERFPYGITEAFKNGYFLSTKYETKRVRFEIPHVVVFANFHPDLSKLSQDRWNVNTI